MYLPNYSAYIAMRELSRAYPYDDETVLTLQIVYPEVTLPDNQRAQRLIGARIRLQVNIFCRYAGQTLFCHAVSDYKYAKQNGFPFRPYEAVLNYTVSCNEHCHLSIYRDRYEFTGGAHGNTMRYSDTWDLQTGALLPLSAFFEPDTDIRRILMEQILLQADENINRDPYIYFEDYPKRIEQNFNMEQYYLTPCGLVIYYQQYEIAPYATGIVEFTIPYETLNWQPNCAYPTPYR